MSRENFVKKYLNDTNDSLLKVDGLNARDFNLAMITATLMTISQTLAQIADMMEENNGGNNGKT